MHGTVARPHGWHFFVTHSDGSSNHYTLEALERRFELGVRGATWEAAALVQAVAHLADGRVVAHFNGDRVASAAP